MFSMSAPDRQASPTLLRGDLNHNLVAQLGTKSLFIEHDALLESGYCEPFNGGLRDECPKGEIIHGLKSMGREPGLRRARQAAV